MHNDKITLILTLKDNVEFTYRWLNYMNNQNCNYKILIADGGRDDSIKKILVGKNLYPNINYEYIRYPYDANLKLYYSKLVDVVNRVETPYILFMDNDDFFILENIPIFIDYLDKNKDTVSCGGHLASLSLYSKNKLVNATTGDNYILSKPIIDDKSIIKEDSADRVCDFFKRADINYLWLNWYFVHNTESVKNAINYLSKYNFKDVVSYEIYLQMAFTTSGKSVQLDYPYYIRQEGTSTASRDANKIGNVFSRFLKNNIFSEVKDSIDYISENFLESEKDKIFDSFITWFLYHGVSLFNKPKKSKLREFFENQNNFKLNLTFLRVTNLIKKIFSTTSTEYYLMKDLEKYILVDHKIDKKK